MALLVLLALPAARADRPQWAHAQLPFAQSLNLDAVFDATHAAPGQLLTTVRRWGVDVRLVRSVPPQRPPNPLLAGLPEATTEQLMRAEFRDSYEGRLTCSTVGGCERSRDLVLIRDSALSYTLIHEFVQAMLRPLQPADPDAVVEQRFGSAFRRLSLYQRRLYDDPYRLLEPLWRRDILSAQADVAHDLFERIRFGQSQEAIVEATLARYIDPSSPYFDSERRAQGLRYGELMLNNAVDLFNVLADSLNFVETTVRQLRQAVREHDIDTGPGESLADADVAAVERAVAACRPQLDRVRAELLALQRLYLR